MNIISLKKILSFALCYSLATSPLLAAEAQTTPNIDLQDLALPTETKDLGKQGGSVYYSSTIKNKTLMPVHFWGEVGKPGLHYIPLDTKLVKGLSFAGGGSSTADLDDVVVNRYENGEMQKNEFDLDDGGDLNAHEYVLHPGDTVFIKKDRSNENRTFYLGLFAIIVSIASTALILNRIDSSN